MVRQPQDHSLVDKKSETYLGLFIIIYWWGSEVKTLGVVSFIYVFVTVNSVDAGTSLVTINLYIHST